MCRRVQLEPVRSFPQLKNKRRQVIMNMATVNSILGTDECGNNLRLSSGTSGQLRPPVKVAAGILGKLSNELFANSRISVVTYSLMSENRIRKSQSTFPDVPPYCLNWAYRRALLLSELQMMSADILCK